LKQFIVFIALTVIILNYCNSVAQSLTGKSPVAILPVYGSDFTADHFGNIYWITGNTLLKINPHTDTQLSYSNPMFGEINQVDASDPLNILVYHGSFNKVVWLDRNLSVKTSQHGHQPFNGGFTGVLAKSAKGGFWIFNPNSQRIEHYSQSFILQMQSQPLFMVLEGFHSPVYMVEGGSRLFVNQPNLGIAVFDLFGNFLYLIEKKGLSRFEVGDNNIFFFSEMSLKSYNFIHQTESVVFTYDLPILRGLIKGNIVYLLTRNGLKIYTLTE